MIDPNKVAERIAAIADREIGARFGGLRDDEVDTKTSPNDLVTVVDVATEQALQQALTDLLPEAVMIGEEGVAADPSSAAQLSKDGLFWVVDPLDGTRNFVNGVREFGTIVALVENGRTIMGWIYAVPEQKMAQAVLGEGALWDGQSVDTLAVDQHDIEGLRSIGWLRSPWKETLPKILTSELNTSAMHCSAYAYLKVMRGLTGFVVSSRLHPWDHAAGALLVREAGGESRYLDGDQEDYQPLPSVDRPLLATAKGREWNAVAERLTRS